jgi:hypothetical protein
MIKLLSKTIVLGVLLAASSLQAEAIDWPQQLVAKNGSSVLIYQPQVEIFSGNSIEGRAAVSVTTSASDAAPVFGAIWFKAKIDTDRDARTAVIRDFEVGDIRFADASGDEMQKLSDFIETQLAGTHLSISVDQLLADLDKAEAGQETSSLKHEPPKIILSTEPAILISIDGEPVLQAIDGSDYERVVNSAFLIVKDGRDYFLYIGSNAWEFGFSYRQRRSRLLLIYR